MTDRLSKDPVGGEAPGPGGDPQLGGGRIVALSVATIVVVTMPVFLTGALAVQMRADLGFGLAALGLAVALFRLAGFVLSTPLGYLADRLGPSGSIRASAATATLASLGIAVLATDFLALSLFLLLAGAGSVLGQAGANLSVARAVRLTRQGLAFGFKQAALPLASLLSGLLVPAVGLTLGWRWAFGLAAAAGLAITIITPPANDRRFVQQPDATNLAARRGPLLVLALGLMLGLGAASTLSAFTVDAAVSSGIDPAVAGLILAAGSALSVTVRICMGWVADRGTARPFLLVATFLAGGAVGYGLLALAQPVLFPIGAVLAFGLGWGFNGLFWYGVVRLNQQTPGRVTGIVMPGGLLGGFLGPLAFGVLVEAAGYRVAWTAAALAALLGSGVMLLGRRLVLRELGRI